MNVYEEMNSLVASWTRLGAMFNVEPARRTPQLEQLLLETARHAARNSRLFTMAVTWLVYFGEYVAKQRLAQMIQVELENDHCPVMALLLESVVLHAPRHQHRFAQAIDACAPATDPRPLFDI